MRPNWPKLACQAQKICQINSDQFFGVILASKCLPFSITYCFFCESASVFYLTFDFDFYVSKTMH